MVNKTNDLLAIADIHNITVLGAGIMGAGIAQIAAAAGYKVKLYDISQIILDKGLKTISDSLSRFTKKGKITNSKADAIISNITLENNFEQAVGDADYVCEAIPEILELKKETFQKLDWACRTDTILATNTSQFSVTAIASATKNRGRVVGTHYFNPAVIMKLVEIVKGLETTDSTIEKAIKVNERFGKEVVVCRKDTQGFITTRLTAIQRVEAYRLLEEGIATPEEIDKAMRLAFNHPMGPFQLGDFAGLDTGLRALKALENTYGDRFKPPQIIERMVDAGLIGKKAGKGFYKYE